MARARGDNSGDGGREIRQQRLPLSWRDETAASSAPSPADDAEAAAPTPAPAADVPAPDAEAGVGKAAPATPAPAPLAPPPADAIPVPPAAPPAPAAPEEAGSARPSVDAAVSAEGPQGSAADHAVVPDDAVLPAPVAVSGGIGDLLLGARADSGFSVEEASARTRIPRDVIEHLECSAYHALPSEYYCRAHIEKLCALYNVDASPIVSRFHEDMVAQRGEAEGLGHFRAVTTDSESGSKISYVLPGPGAPGKSRSISLTGAVVSGVIGLFLLVALVALAALHFRNRDGKAPSGTAPVPTAVGHPPPVALEEFIVPKQLNAYELPIPDK